MKSTALPQARLGRVRRGMGLLACAGAGPIVAVALSCNGLLGNDLATLEDGGHREGAGPPDAPSIDGGAPHGCGDASGCAPSVPSGWAGPLVVAYGYRGNICPSPYDGIGTHDLYVNAWNEACGTCECSLPTRRCDYAVQLWTGTSCGDGGLGLCSNAASGGKPGCFDDPCAGEVSGSWNLTVDGGKCDPAMVPTRATPSAFCSLSAKAATTCESGAICAPKPSNAFFASVWCIEHTGKQPCPPSFRAPYGYGSVTRDCDAAACSCGQGPCVPTVTPCSGGCTPTETCSASGPPVSDTSCRVGMPGSWSYSAKVSPEGGCPASGTLGLLELEKPMTVCCTGPL